MCSGVRGCVVGSQATFKSRESEVRGPCEGWTPEGALEAIEADSTCKVGSCVELLMSGVHCVRDLRMRLFGFFCSRGAEFVMTCR